ncbi:FHA domain-containing protein [Paratractidigestivibacter sp.]|uniref:FHA domain-containing protein n=1 Tax=Paratractidigestivibacter sp. TaxID=2847316 RepID=UPI002AC9AD31|nr:FHA domain-containing protein [Paratractidigestivibacter sp.]
MARSFGKKTCPRCGQQLYEDMTVCYGCLYDFTRKNNGPSETAATQVDAAQIDGSLSDGRRAGEERAEVLSRASATALPGAAGAAKDGGSAGSARASRPDDELTTVLDEPAAAGSRHMVWVKTPAADVLVPLDAAGISVGRGSGNGIVLHNKAVSRRHLRIVPAAGGAEVRDLGSTNPARVNGRAITNKALVAWGEEVELGGAVLAICE